MDQKEAQATLYDDQGYFRRKFPRKEFFRKVGLLCKGVYFVVNAAEIGEGGVAFVSDIVFDQDQMLVINLQIPSGDFISERVQVRSTQQAGNHQIKYGVSFEKLSFSRKRQIRAFVSARI